MVSPNPEDEGMWIHQQAWFHLAQAPSGNKLSYSWNREGNGVYFFVLQGQVNVEGQHLGQRDAYGVAGVHRLELNMEEDSRILAIEVPMQL